MSSEPDKSATARPVRCPICGKPAEHATRPFCSRRCADVDLARWLGGSYVIAGGGADADEDGDEGHAQGLIRQSRGDGGGDGEQSGP